jgi:hypothetical protein
LHPKKRFHVVEKLAMQDHLWCKKISDAWTIAMQKNWPYNNNCNVRIFMMQKNQWCNSNCNACKNTCDAKKMQLNWTHGNCAMKHKHGYNIEP